MKQNLLAVIGLFICTGIFAQTVDTAALQSYPSSIIIKVYDVATKIALSNTQQILLAEALQDQETEMAAAIFSGQVPDYIDSLKRKNIAFFNSLLGKEKADEYYTKTGEGRAATTARLTADMLQSKYHTDTIMRSYFNQIYGWRETQIERIWLRHADTTVRNRNLLQVIYVYDSLLSVYYKAAEGGSYLGTVFHYLDSVQTLDTSKKSAVARQYYTDCMQYNNRSVASIFDTAFNRFFNNVADTVYYAMLYAKEINNQANTASQLALAGLVKRDKISTYAAQLILPHIAWRERGLALVNKLYPNYTPEKDSLINLVIAKYQPSIDSILAKDGNYNEGSQIDIAIKLSLELNLTAEKKTKLQEVLERLNQLKLEYKNENPAGEYDSKAFESEALNGILTPDQYTEVLTTKFYSTASNMALQDWKAMKKNDMSANSDSANTNLILTNYHLATLLAYYRYAHNKEDQYLAVRKIQEVMPDEMRKLLELWEYKTPYADTPDLFYQW